MTEQRTRPKVKEIKDAYNHLFNSSLSLSKHKDAALGGRLFRAADDAPGVVGRSLAWKLFLIRAEPLQTQADVISASPLEALRVARAEYVSLLLEKMRAPDGSYEDGLVVPGTGASPARTEQTRQDLDKNNPLSLDDQNPWTEWFALMELRKTILQDVERTFPDIGYFRDAEVQVQLTNILFVHSITHPDIGYRQGMHELLAPLFYAVDYDSIDDATELGDSTVKEFCSRSWLAADAWALFGTVMAGVSKWYEWQDTEPVVNTTALASHVHLSVPSDGARPYVAPIVQACNRIQSTYLKSVDPELWKSMQSAGIEPQIYGIRWLRLLFTREVDMHDSMILWDGLFACDPAFDLAEWICVAMLIRIRNKLIPSDYSDQLTFLLRYPPLPTSQASADPSSIHHATLLLRQALTLQMSPSPTTGVSVIHENRNLLDIPVETPEPPPPPPLRRPRPGQRGQSFSNTARSASSGNSKANHGRQQSGPMGLPEMFARGLLERSESLGINKTVMNAVSELKRNLPDLATSLARLPMAPQTSYAAYPLVDERPPLERPPWEPRSRFEIERETSDMRAFQRRLGDSVGWIVDTLLQDEGGSNDEDVKVIRSRKREALECLSYVRDVLKGSVTDVEEDRLVGEEESRRRQALKEQREKEAEEAVNRERPIPAPPQPAAQLPAASRLHSIPQAARLPAGIVPSSQPFARSPPQSTMLAPAQTVTRSIVPSTGTSPPQRGVRIAPWNYTRSDFSSRNSPITTLPRVPPRSSTGLPATSSAASSAFTPTPSVPEQHLSRDQAPRRGVQQDPLGALP
ncbi:uncharacterized protein FIBRA_07242 [Fibroporia radiculosa]|uniref:Rab-GAP TBC domain-containing protein n=1 Tax=Fibroporia radiculosa TaxID=599839 RepID=J4GUK3_9APHY|nr:uncharacterized protein FIBRA_07242 [Fibroporia radiculosa]CCM05040.1 predicted protein [Fibroporia radiculosa]